MTLDLDLAGTAGARISATIIVAEPNAFDGQSTINREPTAAELAELGAIIHDLGERRLTINRGGSTMPL